MSSESELDSLLSESNINEIIDKLKFGVSTDFFVFVATIGSNLL